MDAWTAGPDNPLVIAFRAQAAALVASLGLVGCGTNPLEGASFHVVAVSRSNPRVVYAAAKTVSASLGVYRSDDGGESWTPGPSRIGVTGIAVSPGDPNLVLVTDGQRVLRSIDGARTWKQTGDSTTFTSGPLLPYFHPTRAASAYALAVDGSVYTSPDSGTSWHLASAPPTNHLACATLAFDAANADRMYVACNDSVAISNDGGTSWSLSTAAPSAGHPIVLVASPVDGDRVWAISNDGVWASADGAASFAKLSDWSLVSAWPDVQAGTSIDVTSGAYEGGGAEPHLIIGTAWAGVMSVGVNDGAVTDLGASLARRADAIDTVVVSPDGSLFVGTEPTCRGLGGVYKSENRGSSWTDSLVGVAFSDPPVSNLPHEVDVAFYRDVSPARRQQIMQEHKVFADPLSTPLLSFLRTAPGDPRSGADLSREFQAVDDIECVF